MSAMWNLLQEVTKACAKLGVRFRCLDSSESHAYTQSIIKRYSLSGKYIYPLWNHMIDPGMCHNPMAWMMLRNYLKNQRTFLFFELTDSSEAIEFFNGSDIITVLAETHAFVFYVSNEELNYLICFNDHDTLIGSGRADWWVRNLNASAKSV